MSEPCNIAMRLRESARTAPFQRAVVFPEARDRRSRVTYSHLTFQQLDRQSDQFAFGLREMGVEQGTRIVLMVPPSLEFIAFTFALFKVGAVVVLIDPGMGRSNIFRCLADVDPQGFVAIPVVQAIRVMRRKLFPNARFNVTVGGRRWFWRGPTDAELLAAAPDAPFETGPTQPTDPAAIIFTSGGNGPPKGVQYEHGMFDAQVDLLRDFYGIQPGEVDLPGFPLFALFNAAMQVTTVIPDMDPTRPAQVDPLKIVEAVNDQGVTQAFGSPAIWNRVGRYCEEHAIELPSLRRVLSAGAPVPPHVLERMSRALSTAEAGMHTPYGATESLPVASISAREVLEETVHRTQTGGGTCVGTAFPKVDIKIIRSCDKPIETIDEADELPTGEIGEIIVRGPMVTRSYFHNPQATALAKIRDGSGFWHRMGDVGYLDDQSRLWFCGRKMHVVQTADGPMYTIPCEAIFNNHPDVYRSALVGLGPVSARTPAIVIEPEPHRFPGTNDAKQRFCRELLELARANPLTESIRSVYFHRSLPVDIRHNVKIFRERLAEWAAGEEAPIVQEVTRP